MEIAVFTLVRIRPKSVTLCSCQSSENVPHLIYDLYLTSYNELVSVVNTPLFMLFYISAVIIMMLFKSYTRFYVMRNNFNMILLFIVDLFWCKPTYMNTVFTINFINCQFFVFLDMVVANVVSDCRNIVKAANSLLFFWNVLSFYLCIFLFEKEKKIESNEKFGFVTVLVNCSE